MSLATKSLTELRTIAQGLGVKNVFSLEVPHLIQEIERVHKELVPPPVAPIPLPEYDARLMNKPPSKRMDLDELEKLLRPYVERGLKVEFTPEQWKMSFGKRNDQGTLRMPPRQVLKCAARLME